MKVTYFQITSRSGSVFYICTLIRVATNSPMFTICISVILQLTNLSLKMFLKVSVMM